MKRLLTALVAGAAFAAPAAAVPLQPIVATVPVAGPGLPAGVMTRFPALLKSIEAHKGFFVVRAPQVPLGPIRACGRKYDAQACLRRTLPAPQPQRDYGLPLVTVGVLLEPAPGGLVRMTCRVRGPQAADPSQTVVINMDRALDINAAMAEPQLQKAGWCIFKAFNG